MTSKAFDNVSHSQPFNILWEMGFPNTLLINILWKMGFPNTSLFNILWEMGLPNTLLFNILWEMGFPNTLLFNILWEMGFPKHIIVLLKQLCTDQSAVIRWNNILKYLSSNTSAKPCTTNTLANVGSYDLDQSKII